MFTILTAWHRKNQAVTEFNQSDEGIAPTCRTDTSILLMVLPLEWPVLVLHRVHEHPLNIEIYIFLSIRFSHRDAPTAFLQIERFHIPEHLVSVQNERNVQAPKMILLLFQIRT